MGVTIARGVWGAGLVGMRSARFVTVVRRHRLVRTVAVARLVPVAVRRAPPVGERRAGRVVVGVVVSVPAGVIGTERSVAAARTRVTIRLVTTLVVVDVRAAGGQELRATRHARRRVEARAGSDRDDEGEQHQE